MRLSLIIAMFFFSAAVQASSTLRVGSQVLTAGDSRERVIELLGKPASKSHRRSPRSQHRQYGDEHGARGGQGSERWRYRRDDHVTVMTLVDGMVTEIEDHRL